MSAGSAASSGSNDTQVSGYEAEITKQKRGKKDEINKGINVTTSSNDTKISGYKPADYDPEKDDTLAKLEVFKTAGATDIENKKFLGASNLLKGPFKAGSIKTRNYFLDDVLESKKAKKNIGYTKDEFSKLSSTKQEEVYKSYINNRTSGKTDAFGNVNPGYGRDRDNNVQTEKVTAGGQTILTKTKTPEETKVAEEKKEYDARQTKKKGKRKNILTSQRGVTKNSSDYSLGETSLLGRVV